MPLTLRGLGKAEKELPIGKGRRSELSGGSESKLTKGTKSVATTTTDYTAWGGASSRPCRDNGTQVHKGEIKRRTASPSFSGRHQVAVERWQKRRITGIKHRLG